MAKTEQDVRNEIGLCGTCAYLQIAKKSAGAWKLHCMKVFYPLPDNDENFDRKNFAADAIVSCNTYVQEVP